MCGVASSRRQSCGQEGNGSQESNGQANVRVASPCKDRRLASTDHANRAWIYVASHTEHFAELEDGSTGKWCVFRHNDAIDEAWLAIRGAIEAGRLALAKVSTRLTWEHTRHLHL